jgi:hypothetical protein
MSRSLDDSGETWGSLGLRFVGFIKLSTQEVLASNLKRSAPKAKRPSNGVHLTLYALCSVPGALCQLIGRKDFSTLDGKSFGKKEKITSLSKALENYKK